MNVLWERQSHKVDCCAGCRIAANATRRQLAKVSGAQANKRSGSAMRSIWDRGMHGAT
jgi:hypothetical protein